VIHGVDVAIDPVALAAAMVANFATEFGEIQPSGLEGLQSATKALADAVAAAHNAAAVAGDIARVTGALNVEVDGADPEIVLGGFVLDGSLFPAASLKLRLLGVLTVAGAGDGRLRLYDMGAVGAVPAAGVLRATADLLNADAGGLLVRTTPLTVVAAPGVDADQIIDANHRYELRAELTSGFAGDIFKVHNGEVTDGA